MTVEKSPETTAVPTLTSCVLTAFRGETSRLVIMLAMGVTLTICTDSLHEQIDRITRIHRHYIHPDYIIQRYISTDTD